MPLSIGLRNSHDKSMRLAMTCGYRVFVCSNMAFAGDFTPVIAKQQQSQINRHARTVARGSIELRTRVRAHAAPQTNPLRIFLLVPRGDLMMRF
jgi:hypothetical protein